MRIAVTGGGSGGHIFPALAVALHLQQEGHEVHYVGAEGGMETRIVPPSGVPFHTLPAGKYNRRTLQPREAYKALAGLWAAGRLLKELAPQAILTTGGFAGFPIAFVGQRRGVPVVVLEQNATLGLANRWLAPRAARLALAMEAELPPVLRAKAAVTGMPVREVRVPRDEARRALGLDPDLPVLLVLGGSQGSLALNQTLPELLRPWLSGWQVLHQTGERGFEAMRERTRGWSGYHVRAFVDAPQAWSAADAAVTRAGATTLAEAAFHAKPLLLVPLPATVDGGAQERNAAYYVARRAAYVAPQDDPAALADRLEALLADEAGRIKLSRRIGELSPAGATERLARLLLEVAR
ncbi:UDP-N-acetylglucosamine--N-acetylmuramyl-(pentapeptide) pyrophosphoryl-undecaprenol N-acetylglucosamine transferase [Oceanithermus sp.]